MQPELGQAGRLLFHVERDSILVQSTAPLNLERFKSKSQLQFQSLQDKFFDLTTLPLGKYFLDFEVLQKNSDYLDKKFTGFDAEFLSFKRVNINNKVKYTHRVKAKVNITDENKEIFIRYIQSGIGKCKHLGAGLITFARARA